MTMLVMDNFPRGDQHSMHHIQLHTWSPADSNSVTE